MYSIIVIYWWWFSVSQKMKLPVQYPSSWLILRMFRFVLNSMWFHWGALKHKIIVWGEVASVHEGRSGHMFNYLNIKYGYDERVKIAEMKLPLLLCQYLSSWLTLKMFRFVLNSTCFQWGALNHKMIVWGEVASAHEGKSGHLVKNYMIIYGY